MTTDEFIALAERISGEELGDLFEAWLFTDTKPVVASSTASASARATAASAGGTLALRHAADGKWSLRGNR